MKTYQKFMTEKKGDTVVFTFGRFNPPTVGHEKLITAVQAVSRTEGGDYFVYPSLFLILNSELLRDVFKSFCKIPFFSGIDTYSW